MSTGGSQVESRPCHADVAFTWLTASGLKCATARVKSSSRSRAKDTLPIKPVLDELASIRRAFRELVKRYTAAIESEIAHVSTLVSSKAEQHDHPRERTHDLRDMLLLMRSLNIKPEKARRRDLKRIETLLEDLRSVVNRW